MILGIFRVRRFYSEGFLAFSREKNFQTQNKKWPLTYGVFDFGIFGLEITSTRWPLTYAVFDFFGVSVGREFSFFQEKH